MILLARITPALHPIQCSTVNGTQHVKPANRKESGMSAPTMVRDVMLRGVETCKIDTPVSDIARLLLDRALEGVVVMDEYGHGVGVVTQAEMVAAFARPNYSPQLTAEDIVSVDVPQVPPDIPIQAAAQMMQDMNIRAVFLVHRGDGGTNPSAILSYKEILKHMAVHCQE
jgi:CBS domain-containing protein